MFSMCGMHFVRNKMKWSTILCATLYTQTHSCMTVRDYLRRGAEQTLFWINSWVGRFIGRCTERDRRWFQWRLVLTVAQTMTSTVTTSATPRRDNQTKDQASLSSTASCWPAGVILACWSHHRLLPMVDKRSK